MSRNRFQTRRDVCDARWKPPSGRVPVGDCAAGDRWVVVVSTPTRRYGFHLWGSCLLDALNESGVPDADITILFATGAHAGQSIETQRRIVGDAIAGRVRLVDHSSDDPGAVVRVGENAARHTG